MRERIEEGEPRAADFELAARHSDVSQMIQTLEHEQAGIKAEASRRCEMIRPKLEQARARLARLMPAYVEMCARLNIDPVTGLDLEEDKEEDVDVSR